MTALECAFALLKCSPIGNPENSSEYGRAAYILSEHCQGKEDVSEAAMRIFAERIAELERERDEARELLASEKITRNHIIKRSVEVERERDEARAAAKLAYSILGKVNKQSLEAAAARSSIKHINNTPMEWLYSIIQNWKATQ